MFRRPGQNVQRKNWSNSTAKAHGFSRGFKRAAEQRETVSTVSGSFLRTDKNARLPCLRQLGRAGLSHLSLGDASMGCVYRSFGTSRTKCGISGGSGSESSTMPAYVPSSYQGDWKMSFLSPPFSIV